MIRISSSRLVSAIVLAVVAIAMSSCKQELASSDPVNPGNSPIPKTPGTIIIPASNPLTAAKVELGRHLFYDKSLSVDGSTSCASCHNPSTGFADTRGLATSMGFQQRMGTRNAPALANIAYNNSFTWDGRFSSLEAHAPGPIFNQLEMGNNFSTSARDTVPSGYNSGPGPNDTLFLFKRLNGRPADKNGKSYADLLTAAYGKAEIKNMQVLTDAIACFERTFISTQSTFDQYNNGDANAYKYNPQAAKGFELFTGKAGCISCHSGYSFTDQKFHNNGIGINTSKQDSGRFVITKNTNDLYKFKTPSLRNVYLTAPYMHDGRYKTLSDVITYNYNYGGADSHSANIDPNIKPLGLSGEEIADIVEFLKTLSDPQFTASPAFDNPWKN